MQALRSLSLHLPPLCLTLLLSPSSPCAGATPPFPSKRSGRRLQPPSHVPWRGGSCSVAVLPRVTVPDPMQPSLLPNLITLTAFRACPGTDPMRGTRQAMYVNG
ncbi:hypothetical protein BRADI_4g22805v3 [Brachypodium distachyon]|uniref:Secreted protein n=1 Tax=Brachypodium distachyon TaxID=15368 RepID=A0A2K2CPL2_BRADI|nr:hypothetical protein BRADI_4g22805v3 [Brachypodium distachyon]